MATELLEEAPPQEQESAPEGGETTSFSLKNKKVKVAVLLLLVMVVEGAGMYLLMPSRGNEDSENPEKIASVETVEVEVDSFHPVNTKARAGAQIHVNFKLIAIVPKSQEVEFDLAVNKRHRFTVRQAVEVVIREATLEELYDPKLSVLQRSIKEAINKILGKSYVHQVRLVGYQPNQQ